MSKKLSQLFNLPEDDESETDLSTPIVSPSIDSETLSTIEKIEKALPTIRDLETTDKELDEIATMALEGHRTTFDLAMQVEPRFSAEILNSSSSLLGHALTAKTAKINKKLKMVQLQLQKAELERKLEAQATKENPTETPLGTGVVIDRNELLRQILEQNKKTSAKDK